MAHFHEVVDDDAAVFITDLVKGYGDIHVFVEHLVNESVELPVEDLEPLAVRPPGSEPEGELQSDHFYEYAEYEEDNDNEDDDGGYIADFHNLEAMIMLKQIMLTMVSHMIMLMKSTNLIFHNLKAMIMLKLLMLTMVSHMSTDNWDNQAEDDEVEPRQMGGGVMNFDYESEELLSLDESSSSSEHCEVSNDGETPTPELDNPIRRNIYPTFRPVGICCRHSYNNLWKNHPGVLIRDLFWKAVKATYQQAMNELKEVDEDAFKWLQSHSTTIWARSMFKNDGPSNTFLNNMCESFNSRILKFKSKPIITMLECIRLYLMSRFQANMQMIIKVESELCPKIRKRLYKKKLACIKWLACWAGCTKFVMKNGLESFIMDLEEKSCSCRKWDITGIPCCHAISCISKQGKACGKLGHNRRSCKGEVGGNSSLLGSASQVNRTTRRATKDGHANSPAVGSAQLGSNAQPTVHRVQLSSTDDVTTTTPPPPTNNQSNSRPKRQRKRNAVTTETLNASRNAAVGPLLLYVDSQS
ncbi:hypothetical protein SO802_006155 [Lithocarpus litseifolius]|uniref:SWIM-type domain-containing protein n=1 Tax=Lithocarpus litseifolius TaxID=425828 RepID=A0AAW2DK35_9ROSI